ncbi:organic hydroperoxide resistance protein, partial [Streptococcus pluranimalium]
TQLFKADGPDFKLGVEIEVSVDGKSADEAKELGEKAHEVCPYSKATRGNIDVTIIGVDYDASKEAR